MFILRKSLSNWQCKFEGNLKKIIFLYWVYHKLTISCWPSSARVCQSNVNFAAYREAFCGLHEFFSDSAAAQCELRSRSTSRSIRPLRSPEFGCESYVTMRLRGLDAFAIQIRPHQLLGYRQSADSSFNTFAAKSRFWTRILVTFDPFSHLSFDLL